MDQERKAIWWKAFAAGGLALLLGGCAAGAGGAIDETSAPTARLELEARDLTVSVDDAGSAAPGGGALAFTWSFGDGAGADGATPPPHAYARPGTYEITLTVTDSEGSAAQARRTVAVAQRQPGEYAPDDATTGVPGVVADRLLLLDLELPGKGSTLAPSIADETLYVTKPTTEYRLTWKGVAVTLPPGHAYLEGGRLVLDRLHLRGYLDVRAPDVTVRRSVVEGVRIPDAPVAAAPGGVNTGRRLVKGNDKATSGLVLEDIEVRVAPENQRGAGVNAGYHHGLGLEASRLVLLRSEVTGTTDGMQIHQGGSDHTDVLIERSWIHGMQFHAVDSERSDGDPTHADGIQVECSLPRTGTLLGVRLLGNTIDVSNHPDLNAAVMVTRNACATSGLLIANNFLDGAPLALNVGTGLADRTITLYANGNRVGPNRVTGPWPGRTMKVSFTDKVFAVKTNADGGAAYDNTVAGATSGWVYFSFEPPATAGTTPPAGEANTNVMVDHTAGSATWGTTPRGPAGIGLW